MAKLKEVAERARVMLLFTICSNSSQGFVSTTAGEIGTYHPREEEEKAVADVRAVFAALRENLDKSLAEK